MFPSLSQSSVSCTDAADKRCINAGAVCGADAVRLTQAEEGDGRGLHLSSYCCCCEQTQSESTPLILI